MIDMEKMRKKLNALNSKGSNSDYNWWKPTGSHRIRVLPSKDGDPFKEFFFHYLNFGNERHTVLCPKRANGDDCQICELASDAWNQFKESGDEAIKNTAKDLFAKPRYFSNIIVRDEDEDSVQIYGYSKTVYERFISFVLDAEIGDITSPLDGFDVNIKTEKKGDATYPTTTADAARKATKLHKSQANIDALLEKVVDLDQVFQLKEKSEIDAIVSSFVESMDPGLNTTGGQEVTRNASATDSEAPMSADEIFAKLRE